MFGDCTICVKDFDGIPEVVFTYFGASGAGESGYTAASPVPRFRSRPWSG